MKKIILCITVLLLLLNCEAILVEKISDEPTVLLAPSDGVTLVSGTIQFDWQSVSDATNYQIQIATPTFSAATQIVLDSLTNTTTIEKDLTAGEYQWRVKAMNSDSETSYSTNSFSVN